MDHIYQVSLKDGNVGQVWVNREGLYYRFSCRIPFEIGMKYRLYAIQNGNRIDMGLFVPEGNEFILSAKVPIKRFSAGEVTFYLTDREDTECILVKSDEPFPYLNRLNEGFFASRDGIPVVMWDPQPSHNP